MKKEQVMDYDDFVGLVRELHTNPKYQEDAFLSERFDDLTEQEKFLLLTEQIRFVTAIVEHLNDRGVEMNLHISPLTNTFQLDFPNRSVTGLFFSDLSAIFRAYLSIEPNRQGLAARYPHATGHSEEALIPALPGTTIRPGSILYINGERLTTLESHFRVTTMEERELSVLYTGRTPFKHTSGVKLFPLGTEIEKGSTVRCFYRDTWIPVVVKESFIITPAWRYYYGQD